MDFKVKCTRRRTWNKLEDRFCKECGSISCWFSNWINAFNNQSCY